MLLMHKNHVFELQVETKFEACDQARIFLTLVM